MVFSSLPFLIFYLVVVLAVYRLTPLKLRNLFLFAASLVFYGWDKPVYIWIMLLSTVIDYTHGLLVEKFRHKDKLARYFVAQSMVFNLGLLIFFKYYDVLAGSINSLLGTNLPMLNVVMPIGISFYTFQTMSYTIDVYRQDAPVQKNPITFGAYVTLFPQLIAGPIINYKSVAEQLNQRDEGVERFASGVQTFIIGLAKKVLLANSIGRLWDTFHAMDSSSLTVVGGWLGLVAFAFQIYFDFSGYSDMAVGLGRMFGFEFMQNFNHPYQARSISEFWKRWHISLTNWFREYVYIPLGGNRRGKWKTIRNMAIVWSLTGFWHGASWNYLLWGLFFLVVLLLERFVIKDFLAKLPTVLQRVYTLFLVLISWGLFAMEDLSVCMTYLGTCFGIGGAGFFSAQTGYYLLSYLPILLILAVACTDLGQRLWAKLKPRQQQVAAPILMVLALVICTAYLVDATYNPFLYFRF